MSTKARGARGRGGLATLMHDPEELLDNDNRECLARGLSRLQETGADDRDHV